MTPTVREWAAEVARPEGDELLVVVGPTASGKSDLAMALCQRFDAELVGADSVQIYRHFDIGSGKPSDDERRRVPHHLVDVVEPDDPLDAARFVALADEAIAAIRGRGRIPVVCGGTFLWIKALLHGLAPSAPKDPRVRAEHTAFVDEHGRRALHDRLREVDPDSAARLAPNDFVRVSRSLEVYEVTGKTQTAWHAEHRFAEVRHRARLLGVTRSREELDERIARRTASWLAGGWLDEVRDLIARGYRDTRPMDSVGYRQVREHLEGKLAEDELRPAIVRATRTFVRRQRTWLRDQPVTWLG
ncbi:MAG TPA: tRNA (adenosine(37)-N6)-dimethylallyltransferase MiaA [Polyangiaceae bacterium]|nr:tRNA (adenosine(37)-N6)-dimethylallyltransferase MiaA [Polyangiaceae bacterium]